jgi:hypothetical protein
LETLRPEYCNMEDGDSFIGKLDELLKDDKIALLIPDKQTIQ